MNLSFQTTDELQSHYRGVKSRIHLAGVRFAEEKRRPELEAQRRLVSHQQSLILGYFQTLLPWDRLVKHVEFRHGFTRRELLSRSKPTPLANARHELWWLARQLYGLTYPQIAKKSDWDHTTVLHGVRRYGRKLAAGEVTISPEMAIRIFGEC